MDDSFRDLFSFLGNLDDLMPGSLAECISEVAFELGESRKKGSDILFLGSDGKRLVKCLHVPREGLGADGPVLLPGVSKHIIVAAYSDEFIRSLADDLVAEFDTEAEREEEWARVLSVLAHDIAYCYDAEPPESLADIVGDL